MDMAEGLSVAVDVVQAFSRRLRSVDVAEILEYGSLPLSR